MKSMFTDCISDDLIYLRQFKEMAVDGQKINIFAPLCVPSLCRLFIVSLSSSLEHDLNYAETLSGNYSTPYIRNFVKLISLPKVKEYERSDEYLSLLEVSAQEFYREAKNKPFVLSERDVRDFLATRIMRHAIVHMSWSNSKTKDFKKRAIEQEAKMSFVASRNFPTDFMKFDSAHWDRLVALQEKLTVFMGANPLIDRTRKGA